jgi:hypothetical protein
VQSIAVEYNSKRRIRPWARDEQLKPILLEMAGQSSRAIAQALTARKHNSMR